MKKPTEGQNRVNDKTRLLLKFNYTSAILSAVIGLICIFLLDIYTVIPHAFIGYTIANLINVAAFKKHGNLRAMAILTSIISLVSTLLIIFYSGGINSPFIFVLALIVLAGYISTKVFGKIYLYSIICIIVLIYLISLSDFAAVYSVVPKQSKDIFSLISIIFSVYLLGGVFGKDLLRAHHKLYRSKEEIETRIIEKETLLQEVHHRVKNNLQTVTSLLNLQSRNTDNDQIKELIKSSQNRVTSMAMIHEMLYMHDDLSKIEYGTYVKELSEYLIRSLKGPENNITLDVTITDIKLGIDTAIPLGLLINETVTNSLKYGIIGSAEGEINISLQKENDNYYTLKVGDDGVGFSDEINYKKTKSLGLKLIHNLARQLKGSVVRENTKKGTHYTIRFQDLKA